MPRLAAALVGLLLAAIPATALAQAPAASSATTPTPATTSTTATTAIDPEALGVSIPRITRRLQADAYARSQGDAPLKLEFFVDVYGTAPAWRFFQDQDLVFGGVPSTAPTHADMIYQMTPQAFRSPVADFFGLAVAAANAGVRKIDDWRYQRDLRAYQKMLEAGRNAPAPQPPRQ